MSDVLVKVEGVRKKFCRSLKKSLWYGVKDMAAEVVGSKGKHDALRDGEFWAVNDVSFELRRGECLGLIGHNGAGKTTLLKMLNGLIKPDHGRIEMRGRIGALIALGAGFNPILTGRENIYVNGSVLGLSKREIDEKIEEIIDFAEICEFIDTPVQSYSSGMQVRLGFAVATAMSPDILILDEVLAVGDAAFRFKCYNRIASLMRQSAVILVTHNMPHVSEVCTKGLLLSHGKKVVSGPAESCVSAYEKAMAGPSETKESFIRTHPLVTCFEMDPPPEIVHGSTVDLNLRITSVSDLPGCVCRVTFYSESGRIVAEHSTISSSGCIDLRSGVNKITVKIPPICLRIGNYPMDVHIHDHARLSNLVWCHKVFSMRVSSSPSGYADYLIA